MAAQGFLLIATFLLVLMVLARPLGSGLARLINDIPLPGTTGVERVLFRALGVSDREMNWKQYLCAILGLNMLGLALLDDTLTHWHTNARLLQQMMSWWLNAPPQNNDITLPNTFSQSLYDVLMHQRNLAWRDKLRAMPPGRYVVAVGALHLYGEGNLPQMLR